MTGQFIIRLSLPQKAPFFRKPQPLWMRCIWCKVIICSTLCCLYGWITQGGGVFGNGGRERGGGVISVVSLMQHEESIWRPVGYWKKKKKAKRKSEKRGECHKKHLSDGPNGALWARLLVQSVWEEQMTSLNSRRDKGKAALVFTLETVLFL